MHRTVFALLALLLLGACQAATSLPATPVPAETVMPTAPSTPTLTALPSPASATATELPPVPTATPIAVVTLPPPVAQGLTLPKIDRRPRASIPTWNTLMELPAFDPTSDEIWQIDLRSTDTRILDLSQAMDSLRYASFDMLTKWPSADKMPTGFNPRAILETGKNPGLGMHQLHLQGITGRGVGIAIIDQTLLVDNLEYASRLMLYEESEEVQEKQYSTQMHGSAVASIAVGQTVGVAPAADLYYIADHMCNQGDALENDFSCLAKSVRRIIQINRLLPADRKIRVLSMSIGWTPRNTGYAEITQAVKEAKQAGLFVVCSSLEDIYGYTFQGLGRDPLADPDQFESYGPGLWWAQKFFEGDQSTDRLLVPMDSRTTASPYGSGYYAFYRNGGWSWSIPYIAGTYALAAQVKPDITPEEFWTTALATGRMTQVDSNGEKIPFGKILDPVALIEALKSQ